MYSTTNYLFAAYLQTSEGGKKLAKVEKIKPGKAVFFFDISKETADNLKTKFHKSVCWEFEDKRKKTISLAYD